jgi:2-polyprenyl-6-methoxyphenol hydroxylase-like FAD-dependent oxidoreductase
VSSSATGREGYLALLEATAPEAAARLAKAKRPDKLHRFPGRIGYIRQPWGPGWALVGDAGYFKDPIAAHGLTDALRDAELLARAVIDVAAHGRDEDAALGDYETTRNQLSGALHDRRLHRLLRGTPPTSARLPNCPRR